MDKYCINCGSKINDGADICLGCGKLINQRNKKDDKIIWLLLSFLSPVIAMVLYLILKEKRRTRARILLIGVLLKLLLIILIVLLITLNYLQVM